MKLLQQAGSNATPAQACVLFPGALGDFICFLPTLRHLASDSLLVLFARSEYAELVPKTIDVRSIEAPEIAQLFVEDGVDRGSLRHFFAPYQTVYSWMGSRVAVFVRQLQEVAAGRARIFPFRPRDGSQHQIDYYLSCIGSGAQAMTASDIPLAPQAQAWCDEFAERCLLMNKPVLVIAPGSGAMEKSA